MEVDGDGDGIQSEQNVVQARHIKKRALKNKGLAVSFDQKDLSDFVTGFHKRKKKRRKEAQNQQQEALRRKRIEMRKKRKLDREYVLYGGGAQPDPNGEPNENDKLGEKEEDDDDDDDDDDNEQENDDELLTSVSGTKVYDTGSIKVMVTTSEISREDDTAEIPRVPLGSEKRPTIKKKPIKKVEKRRSRPKTLPKREKRKGKKKVEKRH